MQAPNYIGGFFELDLGPVSIRPDKSLATYLNLPQEQSDCFVNARSALYQFLTMQSPRQAWLPAFICSSVVTAFEINQIPVSFYPLQSDLNPDIEFLTKRVQATNVVFCVNYFGISPSSDFLKFATDQSDICFIEDRVHTIGSFVKPWGDWQLYSPRKVCGVPDGGYITSEKHNIQEISTTDTVAEPGRLLPNLIRFEDKNAHHNHIWHAANQDKENAMTLSSQPMSRLSYEILQRMDGDDIIQKRQANYHFLLETLGRFAFLPQDPSNFCPFGFVIRLRPEQRQVVRDCLIHHGIFPAIHWENLPSPATKFKFEHRLARELLTLPCDQRYKISDMELISQLVLQTLETR